MTLGYDAPWRALRRRGRWPQPGHTADDAEHRFADWLRVFQGFQRFLDECRSFRGLPSGSTGGEGLALLRRGERAFLALGGAHLIEPRPSGGRFVGGRSGEWWKLKDGAHCEVRPSGGIMLPGLEQPTSVDVGRLLVTDRRALLCGAVEEREWWFARLVAVHHEPDAPWTALRVSDRSGVSGFSYGHADVPLARFRFMLALAVHTGTVARLRAELETALAEHLPRRPPLP